MGMLQWEYLPSGTAGMTRDYKMDQCWQVPYRNRCAQLSPLKMQWISHCFLSIWKNISATQHKQLNISESQTCPFYSCWRHSQGYWKSNENNSALGHDQRPGIKAEKKPQKLPTVLFSPCRTSGYLNENNMSWQHGRSAGTAQGRVQPGCQAASCSRDLWDLLLSGC